MIALNNYFATWKRLKFHPWWLYLMCNTFTYTYVILYGMYLFLCIHLLLVHMFCILILYMYLQNYIAIEPFAPSLPINKCTIQLTEFYDM